MKLSHSQLVLLDVLHRTIPDDESLMAELQLGAQCRERGLSLEEEWQALGELKEAGLIETETHDFGGRGIRYWGFTSRARAEELLYTSTPLDVGPRSRPSMLAERIAVVV